MPTNTFMKSKPVFYTLFMCLIVLFACSNYSHAAAPAGYSEYYIPGPEDTMYSVLDSLDQGAGGLRNMHAVISVTAYTDSTTVYYDNWEDGYDFDPANPLTADDTFTMNQGQYLIFDSANMVLPRSGNPGTPPSTTCTYTATLSGTVVRTGTSTTCYDGRDRIYVAGGVVTVTRVSWIEGTTIGMQSVAWEIYPVKPQLTTYVVPFGEATAFAFARVNTLIQATQNNTTLTIDLNGDGTPDTVDQNGDGLCNGSDSTTITLAYAGDTFLLNDTTACYSVGTLPTGIVIQGDNTLQVKYITGNTSTFTYVTRGLSAFPRGYWTKDYYAPLDQPVNPTSSGTNDYTDYFLFNPWSSAITINWESLSSSGSFSIPANSTVSFRSTVGNVPIGSGLYFRGSDTFWGVGLNDVTQGYHEWGYSLLPSTMLYTEHYLGWAPGSIPVDPTGNPGTQHYDGVFLTTAQDNTRVFVDFDNDGMADLIDADLNGSPESPFLTLNRLQNQYIYNPNTGDLSGAHFWATGPFSIAYGEKSSVASQTAPALDVGYVAIPGSDFVSLVLTVDKSVSPQVVPTASGSVATFTIKINSQKYTVDGVNATDYLPPNWQYLTGTDTTTITWPDLTTHATDPTVSGVPATGQTLTWTSAQLGTNGTPGMAENQEVTITFTARTTAVLATGTLSQNRVKAVGTRTVGGQTQTFTTTDFVYVTSGNLQITKTSSATDPLYPGNQFTYTVTVTNPASATTNQTGVSIYDPLPAGVSYVAGSGSVTCDIPRNFADYFGAIAYNNTNGSENWAPNPWIETDLGPGAADATGGFIRIWAGQLQFQSLLVNVRDEFNTNGSYTQNDGLVNWSNNWTEEYDDGSASITGNPHMYVSGNRLWFDGNTSGTNTLRISRTANITGATSITISFRPEDEGIDSGEGLVAEYSLNGGSSYTTLGIFDGGTGGWDNVTQTYGPIVTGGATSIILRFRATGAGWSSNDEVTIDNVDISFNASAIGSSIKRTANLTGATNTWLNFDPYSSTGLTAGDTLEVEASSSASGPFTTLATFTGGVPDVAPPYSLAPYISGTTTIQFRVTGGFNTVGQTFNLDNVDISYIVPPPITFAASSPPEFLSNGTSCVILPGRSLTLTYNVTVDNPFPSGQTSITNTASTSSTQLPIAITASVTNTVLVPSALSANAGGRVWLDADGDGVQDIGEPGMPNIEVTLKDLFGTPVATTLTDGNGRYLFTGVTPGTGYYVEVTDGLPAGLTQTFPIPPGLNRTTSFNLTAGQVYPSADLGYRTSAGAASFGDQVWVDADADGVRDAGEIGLGGVTVMLYLDNNDDGVIDGGDTLVSTQITAPDGTYLFTGATAGGTEDYLVSATTPTGYLPTGVTQFRYINVASGSTKLNADFGYQGDTITTYTITDRVWNDTNNYGVFDAGENGIAGVTIELLDASLNVIGTTSTAADGTFIFSGMVGSGADYTVRINDTGGVLLDYYGTTSYALALKRAESNLTASIDRVSTPPPSYGFRPLRSIGDTIFNDLNGNGIQDAGELGIADVVVSLYSDLIGPADGLIAGETLLRSVTTDANGQYLFSGLEDANYIVSVPIPAGYSFKPNGSVNPDTDSTAAGIQNKAAMLGGVNVLDKDFGFQTLTSSRTVSGTIWDDPDADGIIDGGESMLAGVTLEVRRNCPAPCTLVTTVTTDASGSYSVAGLVSDNSYTVYITDINSVLTGYNPTFEYDVGILGPFDNQAPVDLTSGDVLNVNFGFKKPIPTLVTLSDFSAYEDSGKVVVEWATASEHDTAGFYLYRLDENKGDYIRLNHRLLPALLTSSQGGTYSLVDKGASVNAGSITYILVEMEGRGSKNIYGPFTVRVGGESVTGTLNPDIGNLQLPGKCTTCSDRQKKVSSSGITQYVDNNGILIVTNRKNGQKEQVQTDTGTDLFENYSRKAHEMSATKKARIEAGKLARKATKSLTTKGNARVPATEKGKAKIAVAEKGLYYLNASEISTLFGISAQDVIKMNNISISNQGQKVAYVPADNNTGIYFYGEGIDSIYTRENIYWLEKNRGLQMEIVAGAGPAPAISTETFTETIHLEEDHWAAPALFDDPQSDYWVWDYIVAGDPGLGNKTFTIKANGVATSSESARLAVHLKGGTKTSANPDHHVVISLNGTTIGEDWWDGTEAHTLTLSFSQSLLNEGDNTVIVTGLLDTGAPYSIFYAESFDLSYQRYYKAVNNRLFARGDGNLVVTIEGFTDPSIFVFDVSNTSMPKLITSATVDHPVADNYRVSFRPASPKSLYLALTIDGLSTPVSVIVDKASDFKNARNGADYLIIAPAELTSASQVLANYRQRQGLRTTVVELEDIMDEFNYGIYSPEAIRNFLSYTYYNSSKAPRYVVLAGEGTFDYRDHQGYGDNLIPPLMIATPQGLFPSDNLFADINGDHIPEMAIGRLPVVTSEELTNVISKIINYENSSGGTWTKQVLMLADNPDDGGDFPADSNNMAALLPIGYTANKIYLSERSIDEARRLVLDGINSGALLLNYIGHAGVDRLAQEGLLLTSDVASMTNQERLPVVAAMTCAAGQFAIPGYDSLSEVLLLKTAGGAVGVWAPTGLSINSEAVILNEMFFKSTFAGTKQALGDVVLKAIKEGSMNGVSGFILDIYNIMGDPALKLK